MRQYLLLCIALFFQVIVAKGQIRSVSFDASIPSNWSVSNGLVGLSNEHLKGGANSLKWTPQSGSVLTASSLAIPSGEVGSFYNSSAEFFIYSSQVSTDTLVFKFYDGSNVLRREGRMLLNYKGWRTYHRNYRFDYNNGAESSAFGIQKMEIVYKPSSTTLNTLFLDELTIIGNNTARIPGPHLAVDIQHYQLGTEYDKAYDAWISQPDIALTPATANEQTAIQGLKNGAYKRTLGTVTTQQITDAKTYVTQCGITNNPDGSVRGRGIAAIYNVDTLVKISTHLQSLARAYGLNGDTDALSKLQLFLPFLEEQGLAEGGEVIVPYNNYTAVRTFPIGFLEALQYISDVDLKLAVTKMLKWSHEFNVIYKSTPTSYFNIDFLYLKSKFLVELALLSSSDDEIARDLKSFSRHLEIFTQPGAGARGGIKPDGVGFHHNSQHISYLYAYTEWINRAFEFKGTPFKVSQAAYNNMKLAMKSLFLETSKGLIYPNSASGRSPFPASTPVNTTAFDRLVQVGGDIVGSTVEPDLAAFYNYIFQVNRYAAPSVNADGYYQLNYAQTGIMRRDNWVAVSRGFTSRMFGAEIYSNANRYGRYQSYGALEILYDGSLPNTGYITGGNGWDWNMMPGTTTVRHSYDNLKPLIAGTATEFQASDFSGALADGRTGIFGMDFVQSSGTRYTSSGLKFRKSVFTLDSIMVNLGSGISATNASDPTITTLFQGINASTNPAIYINSATATTANYNQSLAVGTTSAWIINGQTTGFYIPAGNPNVNIFRGSQSTPVNTSDVTSSTETANASKAWFSHGTQPSAAKYSYVTVPATTPQKMVALATKIENNELFQILRQTDSVHAVKYLPINATYFSSFITKPDVNIGYLKGVSGRALFSIRESGDSLIVKIASPDLNAVDNAATRWISTVNPITLSIKGDWSVYANNDQASIVNGQNLIEATFALKDGLAQTLVLLKDQLTQEESAGVWVNQIKKWSYNLGTGTGLTGFGTPPVFQQGSPVIVSTTYSHSTSSAQAAGFLPYPPDGLAKVLVVNNNTLGSNGNITLHTDALSMSASSTSSVNKFSAFEVENATAVANMFFRISFSETANNGNFIYSIGNKAASTANLFSNSSGVYRATTELFTALQWELTASGISFRFRESANTSGGTYKLISDTFFSKGVDYDIEIYCNNSTAAQSYTREGQTYQLAAGKFNIWARPAGQLVRTSLLSYNSSTAFSSSGELAPSAVINSFLFQGTNSTLPNANTAVIRLTNMEMNFASLQALPVQMVSFTGQADGHAISLNWKTASEINTDKFTVYRSVDGKNFEQLTELNAAGNSSQVLNYVYRDNTLPLNTPLVYYKLKLTDKDGTISYDNVVDVKLKSLAEGVVLYPNPVSSILNISYPVAKALQAVLRIIDMSGKTVYSSTYSFAVGINQLSIDVSALPKGVYLIRVDDSVNKIIKL